jgi:hypothetical protein
LILVFCNDATVLEYLMQDEFFLGVVGMLECMYFLLDRLSLSSHQVADESLVDDPEFPKLKASHREFISNSSRFRQAVEIKDAAIREKIHQTYRLQYLKDVVLARSLEDSTFNILNPLIFYNQSDIIQHIQSNEDFLDRAFASFHPPAWDRSSLAASSDPAVDAQREDVVLLLHQLLLMSKNIALPSRLQLVRILLDHGLVLVFEWAFSYHPPTPPSSLPSSSETNPNLSTAPSSHSSKSSPSSFSTDHIKNPAVEMLAHALDHDPAAVRQVVIKENDGEEGGTTLVVEMIRLLLGEGEILTERPLISEKQTGVKSQLADAMKQLLDTGDSENTSVRPGFSSPLFFPLLAVMLRKRSLVCRS